MKLWPAKVIDNNDADLKGKVQIYIEPLMWGLKPADYPWAYQDREFTSFIPEVDDFVWVWFEEEDTYRKPFYRTKISFEEYSEHNSTIGSLTGSYPDLKYLKLKNGVSIALNSNQTEASIVAGSAEIFINSSGEIHIKGSSGTLEFSLLGEKTKAMIEKLLDKIVAHGHSSAVGPTGAPLNAAEFTAIKTTDVATILSTKVKNN